MPFNRSKLMMSIEVIMQVAITQFYSNRQGVSLITTLNGRNPMRPSMLEHQSPSMDNFPGTVFDLGRTQSVFHYACNHDHTQPSELHQSFETTHDVAAPGGSLPTARHAHYNPRDHKIECQV